MIKDNMEVSLINSKINKMNCPLCETQLEIKADEYFFICSKCGAYIKDKKYYITPQEEKERYEQHNNDINDIHYIEFTSPITQAIFERFDTHHLGLDYGCGTGPVISKVLQDMNYRVNKSDPFFIQTKIT
jgi:ribosomal protein L37AE/L43A